MTLHDQILAFLSEHPSSTARMIADALSQKPIKVSTQLMRMVTGRAVSRSAKQPFTYTLHDPSAAVAMVPSLASLPPRIGNRLADEQRVLTVLTEGQADNRETLLDVLRWDSDRLDETLDRLHSAQLIKTVQGSYVLTPRTL